MTTATMIARRALLLAMAGTIGLAGLAMAGGKRSDNPWAGRHLLAAEREGLQLFGEVLRTNLAGHRIEVRLMDNHLRLRLPADSLFDTSEAEIGQGGRALLTVLAEEVLRNGKVRAEVVAHHDAPDSSYRALIVSKRRAEAVVAHLVTRQVPSGRLKATGLGDRFPLSEGKTRVGRVANSRIEILFRPL